MSMGMDSEDLVKIENGKSPTELSVITVNCQDKLGLACDLCRIILNFGLLITKGDLSTDGRWCFVVFWVVPRSSSTFVQWTNLKNRLISVCPTYPIPFIDLVDPVKSKVYLLKLFSLDRNGLLHDVTRVLRNLDLSIHRVKVSTTPDGRVIDLFYITDGMELLHTRKRQDDTCEMLHATLGDSSISCEIQLAEDFQQWCSSLPACVFEELFSPELPNIKDCSQGSNTELEKLKSPSITVDNKLSPSHTLLQIHCLDQRGLLYDILRTMKDCNMRIAHGRFSLQKRRFAGDFFIVKRDGKKIVDPEKLSALCSQLRQEMLHSLRVMFVNRGPDNELLVANPAELCGEGRPLVFYDVTRALKVLGICIFSAEIGRHTASGREWEVYRFLLDENTNFTLSNARTKDYTVDIISRTLMGW
ncbi:[Protein-PII] uridylyltransferase protein [Dioscorea alata]|uniref:[Protein-PII] uridylyltransferase protein n=1 Tax=Dioscorea alata TaxID=55571 RepID=A0ACB7V3I8_DIOAL|nr:[Protein-PII] uridylyltransferase protein [Dioscorea alata]